MVGVYLGLPGARPGLQIEARGPHFFWRGTWSQAS